VRNPNVSILGTKKKDVEYLFDKKEKKKKKNKKKKSCTISRKS